MSANVKLFDKPNVHKNVNCEERHNSIKTSRGVHCKLGMIHGQICIIKQGCSLGLETVPRRNSKHLGLVSGDKVSFTSLHPRCNPRDHSSFESPCFELD